MEEAGVYTFLPLEKVYYGAGSLRNLPAEVDRLGCRGAFLITGRRLVTETPLVKEIEGLLGERHAGTFSGVRQHAPESDIHLAAQQARECGADLLVSLGGGSPIDAAKAAARQLASGGPSSPFLPHIAVPTTLSAAEFSHSAGFTDEVQRAKVGFSDPAAVPRVVILDAQAAAYTPLWLWLSSGIRALDHAVETITGKAYHPVNDVLALQAIRDLFEWLPRSRAKPDDLRARHHCQMAAWMSYFGPASAGAQLGLSHTIGKRIGATYDVPHGVTSCIILPHVLRYQAARPEQAARLAMIAAALDSTGGHLPGGSDDPAENQVIDSSGVQDSRGKPAVIPTVAPDTPENQAMTVTGAQEKPLDRSSASGAQPTPENQAMAAGGAAGAYQNQLHIAPGAQASKLPGVTVAGAVADLIRRLDLPTRLRDVHVPRDALESIAAASLAALAGAGAVTQDDIYEILREAW